MHVFDIKVHKIPLTIVQFRRIQFCRIVGQGASVSKGFSHVSFQQQKNFQKKDVVNTFFVARVNIAQLLHSCQPLEELSNNWKEQQELLKNLAKHSLKIARVCSPIHIIFFSVISMLLRSEMDLSKVSNYKLTCSFLDLRQIFHLLDNI